ncbi:MAG TPA: amidase [Acidimicrobiales bacterium]|nr:amidase [Acidimicrobiales bacterium]
MDAFPTALGLAELIRTKQVSPVEVLDETITRIDALNPALNAVIWRNDDEARADAKRAADLVVTEPADALPPFLGVPIPIKDLTAAAGQPLTHGSNGGSDELQTEDELTVAAFRRAGMILTGRTNSPEFGTVTATENERYGITRNPWNTDHTPGGSSGGAASATAAGMFAIGHGGDGGGSLRIPGSCCGLVGFKVSRGRVPTLIEAWEGAAVEGVVSHTVADTAAILDLIARPDPLCWYNAPPPDRPFVEEVGADPGRLRIGMVEGASLGLPVADACIDALHSAGRALEGLGHHVEPTTFDFELAAMAAFITAVNGSFTQNVDWSKVSAYNQAGHQQGLATDAVTYLKAIEVLQEWSRRAVSRWGTEFDVLLTPTMTIEPPPAGQILREITEAPDAPPTTVMAMVAFTAPFNLTGLPAVSLPLHQAPSGLPVGVQLVERPFNDAGLLRLASQLEEAMPWRDRHPA